jgi:hypothetical protein
MREHIRREAGQFVEAAGWAVPLAFATAALAVIALGGNDGDEAQAQTAAPAAVVPAAESKPQSEEATPEVEHVQAF